MIFTQTRLNALKCPPGQRDAQLYYERQRGLGFRVLTSGSKSYFAHYTRDGKKQKIPLGSFYAISLGQATAEVQAIQGDLARGVDPKLSRKQAVNHAMTLAELLEDWRALHLNGRRPHYAPCI